MSWLNWSSTTSTRSGNPNFTQQARGERRVKLEADRLFKAQKKADRQAFFKAGISEPPSPISLSKSTTPVKENKDYDLQSLPDIFFIDIDVFQEVRMVNFDSKNDDNGADAMKNLGQIRISWDPEDPSYFFSKLETELQIFSINKQFTKRQALIRTCLTK